MDLIQVDILGLSTSSSSGGAYALVLGETDGSRRLPIIIGAFEAQAIALELEKIQPPRPMTHDLLRDLLEIVGGDVNHVVVNELRDGTFFAQIIFSLNGQQHELDARPSDAVALAVRADSPIYVMADVLNEAGIPGDDEAVQSTADVEEKEKDPPKSLLEKKEALLEKAITDENYERAAQLRDEIEKMKAGDGG